MIKRSKFNEIIGRISDSTGINMADTSKVLTAYIRELSNSLDNLEGYRDPLYYGILKLDAMIKLQPGITIIYSADDMGKTSTLKTIAANLVKQGQAVLYIDAENKLFLHQLDSMSGVYFGSTRDLEAVRQLIDTELLDAVVIDTISSMPHNTLKAFMFTTRKKVPFIIMAAQMRVDIQTRTKVPACSDSMLSSAHTHIYLTESEKILFEKVDMRRVQFSIMKYEADVSIQRQRSSFIISKNMVNNFWSSVDYLHSTGLIRAHGQNKYLDGKMIGKYSDIISRDDIIYDLIRLSWSNLTEAEADLGIFCESGSSLCEMPFDPFEGEPDDITPGEEELSDSDGAGLSYN